LNTPDGLNRFRSFLYSLEIREKCDFLLLLGDLCGHAPDYLPRISDIIDHSGLKVHALPGNHDDHYGKKRAWYEPYFKKMVYSFDHKGWHIIMNWSQKQPLDWLGKDLSGLRRSVPVLFCQHYPLKQESPETKILMQYENVRGAFTGHVHRWTETAMDKFKSYTLDNCYFNKEAKGSIYYIINAFSNGTLRIQSCDLDSLELQVPPDKTPEIRISEPVTGDILEGPFIIKGHAKDDHSIKEVELSIDNGPWQPASGYQDWHFNMNFDNLSHGHHLFMARAIDTRGQPSVQYGSIICLVKKNTLPENTMVLQQGRDSFLGCRDTTFRREGGMAEDLECWTWKKGEEEYHQFCLQFDIPVKGRWSGRRLKHARLILYCNRQNFQSLKEDSAGYMITCLKEDWNGKAPVPSRTDSLPSLSGSWPRLTYGQKILPPRPVIIDISSFKQEIEEWIVDPSRNHGFIFSPDIRRNYNFSALSSKCYIPTLRPRLEIEFE
jgi:hypothetical protein